MMRRFLAVMVLIFVLCFDAGRVYAQGTKLWTQSRYDEMERGTAEGVAIRNDGRLEVAPDSKLLYTTIANYVWSIATDASGNAYLGRGGTTSGSAVVTRVSPDGIGTDIFAGKELAVQALKMAPDGSLFAATSPDGKVYRIQSSKSGGFAVARVIFDPAETAEKPKYLWDLALSGSGDVYVAAGAPAVVYRVPSGGGKAQVVFRTSDQHIRCLMLAPNGLLYAGSDGGGVIYRINPSKTGAAPFAVYSASRREITALAMDGAGNLYAAGVGAKGAVPLPNLPVTGGSGITITFVQPGSSTAATTSTVIPDGSEIYKIATDGSPSRLLSLKDDVVYALAMRHGELLAATGNRGRIYRVDTMVPGRWTDIAHLNATQAMAFASAGKTGSEDLLIATSNSGRVFRLADRLSTDAVYTSAVFDAQIFSQWGRAEIFPALLEPGSPGGRAFFERSGNVENPAMGWSDWIRTPPNAPGAGIPGGRYAQWRVELHDSATVDAVSLNYLAKNIAPVVDELVVQPGARMASPAPIANTTMPINFPSPVGGPMPIPFQVDTSATPLIAQKDRTAITVRWSAHDDNGDDLVFSLFYKGEGESNWRPLKDKIGDRFYSFDSALLPDGTYSVKVVASDSPVHTDAEALTGDKVSAPFVIDTTPPVPGVLTAAMEGEKIHARFDATDATSPIAHAEFSVDAGPWEYLEPSGRISDSLSEHYDFLAAVPIATSSLTDAKEHVIAVRVYDRFENVVTAKAVVR